MAWDTIGEAARTEHTGFQVYCWGKNEHGYPCRHTRRYGIMHAIVLWGAERKLGSLRFVCTRCGFRTYELNFYKPHMRGAGPMCALEHHARMYRYHFRFVVPGGVV